MKYPTVPYSRSTFRYIYGKGGTGTPSTTLSEQSATTTTTTHTPTKAEIDATASDTSISVDESIRIPWKKSVRRRLGSIVSAMGFATSATTSLWSDRSQIRRWKNTANALRNFLNQSGIDLEISPSVNHRLLDNLIILSRVEKAALNGRDRRDLAVFQNNTSSSSGARRRVRIPSASEALRYMKYATAVYGDAMIRAAELDALGKLDANLAAATSSKISAHCSIPEDCIVLMDVDYSGSDNHLRHFVAVDHKAEKIVLAIRGTFSISELVVDAAGFSRPFCGGEAHSEMATMAERVWEAAGTFVLQMLEENPTYDLVLTGHSLGGGTASLLNIMLHENKRSILHGRKVRCYAFAAPPTYAPLYNATDAVRHCIHFIHERDVVPFLSVDAVRHLFNCIKVIDDLSLSWTERLKLMWGYSDISQDLIDRVQLAYENRLVAKPGAPILAVPAAATVWMREQRTSETRNYDIKICDPEALSTLGILLDRKMIEDHFPSRYEHALHHLVEWPASNTLFVP